MLIRRILYPAPEGMMYGIFVCSVIWDVEVFLLCRDWRVSRLSYERCGLLKTIYHVIMMARKGGDQICGLSSHSLSRLQAPVSLTRIISQAHTHTHRHDYHNQTNTQNISNRYIDPQLSLPPPSSSPQQTYKRKWSIRAV